MKTLDLDIVDPLVNGLKTIEEYKKFLTEDSLYDFRYDSNNRKIYPMDTSPIGLLANHWISICMGLSDKPTFDYISSVIKGDIDVIPSLILGEKIKPEMKSFLKEIYSISDDDFDLFITTVKEKSKDFFSDYIIYKSVLLDRGNKENPVRDILLKMKEDHDKYKEFPVVKRIQNLHKFPIPVSTVYINKFDFIRKNITDEILSGTENTMVYSLYLDDQNIAKCDIITMRGTMFSEVMDNLLKQGEDPVLSCLSISNKDRNEEYPLLIDNIIYFRLTLVDKELENE